MIEGPYSSLDPSHDGRFVHLSSSVISLSSSSSSSSSPLSLSSTSPSSFAESPLGKSLIAELSASSSTISVSPSSSTDISIASSVTSVDLTSPTYPFGWGDEGCTFSTKACWPRGIDVDSTSNHISHIQSQARMAQPLPKEQLQNPRRTKRLLDCKTAGPFTEVQPCHPPPPLVRQAERKVNFVDNLVDTAAQIVEAIWPSSVIDKSCEPSFGRVLPLRTFIQETLRRSRTSYSTLQVALYYIFVIRPFIPPEETCSASSEKCPKVRALHCGRRMFLAALILASKYLQDRNYSARAWSKISGLNIPEINANEIAFLSAVNWRLHISDCIFDKWTKIVLKCTPTTSVLPSKGSIDCRDPANNRWIRILSRLDRSLDTSVLDDILMDDVKPVPTYPISKLPDTEYFKTPAASWRYLENMPKMCSMALALSGLARPVENLPKGCPNLDDCPTTRTMRKSSLSMCETMDALEVAAGSLNNTPSTPAVCNMASQSPNGACKSTKTKGCSTPRRDGNVLASCNATNVSQRMNSSHPYIQPKVPAREEVLGKSNHQLNFRPEPIRVSSAPIIVVPNGPELLSGKTRKRGNETPVAARQQKKQKDKQTESASQKPPVIVPSGLTPQMRQMNTSFSLASKKGNGLRMSLTPNFLRENPPPGGQGQIMRPNPAQRSMSHVYG